MQHSMQHSTHHAPVRHLGIREAARALGKAHTTIGRYIAANPVLNHGTAERPKVDLEELRQHRAANVNPFKSGSHAGLLFGQVIEGDNGLDVVAPEPGSLGAIREKIAEEELALKIEARLIREGELLPADGVKASFDACFRRIRRKAEMIETWADDLAAAGGGDAGALRAVLKEKSRLFQAELSMAVADLAGEA